MRHEKSPARPLFFILLWQGKDNYAKIGTRLFPVARNGFIVGQVRTVVERAGVTGDFKEFIRVILAFIQVYLFSVYQGVGRFAGERTAAFEQEADSLQGAHGVEQSGRNALQALASGKGITCVLFANSFSGISRREVHPLNMPSNLVTLVMLANKSSGISVNEVQFEKRP